LLALDTGAATRVVVSGAGPAGLLSAHEILLRRPDARVTLFDRRPDPRTIKSSGERAYSLGLNIRGRTALQHWDGLWEAVSSQGVLSSRFLLHLGSKELQLRSNREGSVPTLLISRDALCSTLLDFVQARHAGRLDLRLGTAVERVDLARHECFTPEGECFPYDDLIGARQSPCPLSRPRAPSLTARTSSYLTSRTQAPTVSTRRCVRRWTRPPRASTLKQST
jgi:2-polyprenyl-6-methoxyphenol hydroxylase-like FAD-dependent oxidoreductase